MKLNKLFILLLIGLSACGVDPGTSHIVPKDQIQSIAFQDKKHTKLVIILNYLPWEEYNLDVLVEASVNYKDSVYIFTDHNSTYS